MKGTITLTFKVKSKKPEYCKVPFLFDPRSLDIRYAYPVKNESIIINIAGELLEIDYEPHVWKELEKRFVSDRSVNGFTPESTKPKQKKSRIVKF